MYTLFGETCDKAINFSEKKGNIKKQQCHFLLIHSPPSSANVKNAWSYTSTPPIRLHGVVLSFKKKHKNNFTFTLPIYENGKGFQEMMQLSIRTRIFGVSLPFHKSFCSLRGSVLHEVTNPRSLYSETT
jgi:hypothetical protein